ncbi:MAG: MarR family winged helix-turn-helix transcriptional regulator [Clostridiales bacterium]|nr:MarR family winged helix-turn-helix transcriptional regulator [Clostridiales bacterium]
MIERCTGKEYSDVEAVDIIHQVANFYINTKTAHDYGTGEEYTSVEVHTLKHIADNPGITVTELARDNGKTKGAISQILKKIEAKGLVERHQSSGRDNRILLYLTDKGRILDEAHRKYDEISFGESMGQVREVYSKEEINLTFSVLETWLGIRREIQEKRMNQKV